MSCFKVSEDFCGILLQVVYCPPFSSS